MALSFIAWLLLAASVLAEVLGTVALRHADGFTRLALSLLTTALYGLTIWLMSLSTFPRSHPPDPCSTSSARDTRQ